MGTRSPQGQYMITSINPVTGQMLRQFEPHSDKQIQQKLEKAVDAFEEGRRASFAQRVRCMIRAAEILEAEKAELARTMTLEMGKPIRAAIQEVEKCASACHY